MRGSRELERAVCAELEKGLALEARPYARVAGKLGARESEVLACAQALLDSGLIRFLGAFVDFRALGFAGVLIGAAGDEKLLRAAVSGKYVTHAYLREADPGFWFTALLRERQVPELSGRLAECGVPHVALSSSRRLKLKTSFACENPPAWEPAAEASAATVVPGDAQLRLLSLAQKSFPLAPRPFEVLARRAGTGEDEALAAVADMSQSGVLRRIGASVRHERAGYVRNSLVAWDMSDRGEDQAARDAVKAAGHPWLSHCYLRRVVACTLPFVWRYNLFTMIHARTDEELSRRIGMLSESLARPYVSMPTAREIKKTTYGIGDLPADWRSFGEGQADAQKE